MPPGAVGVNYALHYFYLLHQVGSSDRRHFYFVFMAQNHSFSVELACKVGIEGAVILQHFHFLQQEKSANEKKPIEGIFVKRSVEALTKTYPYFTAKVLKRIISNLESDGHLFSRIQNDNSYDRSKSYTLSTEMLSFFGVDAKYYLVNTIVPNGKIENTKQDKDIEPNGPILDYTSISTSNYTSISNNKENKKFSEPEKKEIEKPLPQKPNENDSHRADALKKVTISAKDAAKEVGYKTDSTLVDAFQMYLDYRKEMKLKPFASVKSSGIALKQLKRLSEESRCTSLEIVEQTIANLWTGLFPLKRDKAQQNGKTHYQPIPEEYGPQPF